MDGCVLQVIPGASEDQLILIDMISAIKLLSVDTLMQTVRQVMKQPPQQTVLSASKASHFCISWMRRCNNSDI